MQAVYVFTINTENLTFGPLFFSQRDKLNIRVQTEGYKGTLDNKTEYWYSSDMNTLLPHNLKQLPT